jgi:hypothetical protein
MSETPVIILRDVSAPPLNNVASVGVNFPEIFAGSPLSVHAVDSAKTPKVILLLRFEDAKLRESRAKHKHGKYCFGAG